MADPWDAFPDAEPAAAGTDPWAAFPDDVQAPAATAPPPPGPRRLEFDANGNARVEYGDAPPRVAPDTRGYGEQAMDLATTTTRGAWTGLAKMAGMPVDAINNLPRLRNVIPNIPDMFGEAIGLPGPDLPPAQAMSPMPLFGSDALQAAGEGTLESLEAAGIGGGTYEPQNTLERFGNRVGQEVGAQALPVAGLVGAGARAGVQGARQMGPLGRFFVEPFAVNPGKAAGEEIAAGVATGVGAQAGREIGGQDSAAADLAGSFAGGGLYAASRAVVPALGDLVAALTGSRRFASDTVNTAVADEIIRSSDTLGPQMSSPGAVVDTDPLVQALGQQPRVEQLVPGYTAGTAEAAGDVGLSALEASRASGPRMGTYVGRQRQNTAAVDAKVDTLRPEQTPGALTEPLEQFRSGQLMSAEEQQAAAQGVFDATAARLQPQRTAEGRGTVVRGALDDAERAARDEENQAWRSVVGEVDAAPLAQSFGDVTKGLTQADQRVVSDLNAAVGSPAGLAEGGPVDLEEITSLRSELTSARRQAKSTGDTNRARVIKKYVSAIDSYLDNAVPDDVRTAYDQARATSFRVNERFNRPNDEVSAVLRRREGRPNVADSDVANRFTPTDEGNLASLESLMREADTPDVKQALRDELLAQAQAGKTIESPQRLEDFVDQRSGTLSRIPGLADEMRGAAAAGRGVEKANFNLKSTQSEFGDTGKSPVAKYLRYGDEKAAEAMKGVFSSGKPAETMDTVLKAVGDDPVAVGGARAAFWDLMESKTRGQNAAGVSQWMPRKWVAFLGNKQQRPAIERLYQADPQHLKDLDELAGALENAGRNARSVVAGNPSRTALAQRGGSDGPTLAEWQSKYYEVARGRVNPLYFGTYMAGKVARGAVRKQSEQAYQKLLDDALLDKDIARGLLTKYNPANRAAMERKLRTWYGDRANTLIELLDEDEGDEQ